MDKKIFVFLLVAVVVLSLSAVSATDDVDVSASYDDGTVAGEANDISIDVTAKDIYYGEDATVEAKIIPNTTAGILNSVWMRRSFRQELLLTAVQV